MGRLAQASLTRRITHLMCGFPGLERPGYIQAPLTRRLRRNCLLLLRVIADARRDFVAAPGHLDADAAEAPVSGGRGRRVVERVLVAQLVGDLGVDAFERAETLGTV